MTGPVQKRHTHSTFEIYIRLSHTSLPTIPSHCSMAATTLMSTTSVTDAASTLISPCDLQSSKHSSPHRPSHLVRRASSKSRSPTTPTSSQELSFLNSKTRPTGQLSTSDSQLSQPQPQPKRDGINRRIRKALTCLTTFAAHATGPVRKCLTSLPHIDPVLELDLVWRFSKRDLPVVTIPGVMYTACAISSTGGSAVNNSVLLGVCSLYFLCILVYFNISNQICDIEEDRIDKPDRPLPRGMISIRGAQVRWIILESSD